MVRPDDAIPHEVAFELVGHKTRLAILRALYEEHELDEPPPRSPVSFTTLRKRVGMDDGSQFNYHLKKLVGRYIAQTGEGYLLEGAGYRIIQTVLAGTALADVEVAPKPFDIDCEYCGEETAVGYQDGYLYRVCTSCVGSLGRTDSGWSTAPSQKESDGILSIFRVEPNWLTDRTDTEITELLLTKWYLTIQSVIAGLCQACSGVIEGELDICRAHDSSGETVCSTCNRRYQARAQFQCTTCSEPTGIQPEQLTVNHPAVVKFAADRGLKIGDPGDCESLRNSIRLAAKGDVTTIDAERETIAVTIPIEPAEIRVRIDAQLDCTVIEPDMQARVR